MLKEFPKISIITPSFNDASFLEKTILSVIDQEYPNLEYIVIDGGSTDGSVDIIKRYEGRIGYWVSEPDKGQYDALQKGFSRSTGEIMGWINSDDMHHPGSLFTIAQIFSDHQQVNWLQGVPNMIDESGRIVYALTAGEIDRYFFYGRNYIHSHRFIQQESTFWRRILWEKAGNRISTEYKYAGDFDLWIRFFQFEKLYNFHALLGSFRYSRSGQASFENYQEYIRETLAILEKYPLNKKEKRQMQYLDMFHTIEKNFHKLGSGLKNRLGLKETSVVNDRLNFDYRTQEFKM
jgi:glycosyltransferase involved in cell wall biosynthesis